MANIPIRDIALTGVPTASSKIVFDDGQMKAGLVSDLADGVRPVASQGEAEAGADNAKTMTALRVKQQVTARIGVDIASQSALATKADVSSLSPVATSGDYNDLSNKPSIPAAGLPVGGATGQVLAKSSASDYDAVWSNAGAGDMLASVYAPRIPNYDTRTAAIAATVPAAQNMIVTGGYGAAGDGGGARYVRVAAPAPAQAWHFQSADGSWWELAETTVDVRMLGASTSASGSDNASAINAALLFSSDVYIPAGTYDIGATLVTNAYRTLRGAGRYQTALNKTFNGDFMQLGTGSLLIDLAIDGNGATYTGRGITIGVSTGSQWISRVRIEDFSDYCVEYTAASAGTQGGLVEGCMLGRTANNDVCVKYPVDSVAAPRYLWGVICTGHYTLCDTNGAQNLFIVGCYCGNITFGGSAGKVLVLGTRIALVGVTMTVQGSDLIMDGCAIGGSVVWQAGAGSSYGDQNVLGGGTFTDNTNSSNVGKLYYPATSFTPSWKADTSDPTIGNGTITGEIAGHGKFRRYTVQVNIGSTTTFGSGQWYIPLRGIKRASKDKSSRDCVRF